MNELPKRKPNRLKEYDYSQNGAYFVTICTKNRENLFGTIVVGATAPGRPCFSLNELGKCVDETINNANNNDDNDIKIDKYTVMPNHVHLIVVICSETGDRGFVRVHQTKIVAIKPLDHEDIIDKLFEKNATVRSVFVRNTNSRVDCGSVNGLQGMRPA